MVARIQSLARKFTQLTGNPSVESYATQGEAREFLNAGFTEDDLSLMVRYRKATVKEPHILKAMLRWRFIIGDTQRFAEDLPEAKAHFKYRQAATDREKVLLATGRTIDKPSNLNTAHQVLSAAGQNAFEEFKAFRRTLE